MRIISYNTRGSLGMDGIRSTPRIAGIVRPLTPDIVCFQEIHRGLSRSGREDQPAILSSLLGRPFYFQNTLQIGFGNYGIGIATRSAPIARVEHLLPSGKEQRGALEVHLRNIGGFPRLTVFCTHWGLEAEERIEQARELARLVNTVQHPVIVCGDLNETPEGAGVKWLLSAANLSDADAVGNNATFDSDNPRARIDYCLYSSELQLQHIEIISTYASDHLPLLADFEPSF